MSFAASSSAARRLSFVVPLAAHEIVVLPQLGELQLILQSTQTDSILPPNRELYTISINSTLSAAVSFLARHKILAAPVLNADLTCAGIIDSLTIVDFLQAKLPGAKNSSDSIGSTPIQTVLQSSRSVLKPFFLKNPLSLLAELFSTGVHRVALISESFEIVNICSQSDLIHFLADRLPSSGLNQLISVPVAQFPLCRRSIISMTSEATVKDCLYSMNKNNVTSLAIVNDSTHNQLTAEFSGSDLRGVSNFKDIHLPVLDFLRKYHPTSLKPLTIDEKTPLLRVLQLMAEHRMKRAWIVDQRYSVIDLVSSTDICSFLTINKHAQLTDRELNGNIGYSQLWRSEAIKVRAAESEPEVFEFHSSE